MVALEEDSQEVPTPKEIAELLLTSGMQKDDILNLLKETAESTGGWTPRLNEVGLRVLKPDAPEGLEKEA